MPYEADGLTSLALGLGILVALLWAALWLLRRARPGGCVRHDDCRIVRSLNLGPREKLVVVAIGRRQVALGVGSAAVSLLCELDEPLSPPAPAAIGFGEAVRQARLRWHGQ